MHSGRGRGQNASKTSKNASKTSLQGEGFRRGAGRARPNPPATARLRRKERERAESAAAVGSGGGGAAESAADGGSRWEETGQICRAWRSREGSAGKNLPRPLGRPYYFREFRPCCFRESPAFANNESVDSGHESSTHDRCEAVRLGPPRPRTNYSAMGTGGRRPMEGRSFAHAPQHIPGETTAGSLRAEPSQSFEATRYHGMNPLEGLCVLFHKPGGAAERRENPRREGGGAGGGGGGRKSSPSERSRKDAEPER